MGFPCGSAGMQGVRGVWLVGLGSRVMARRVLSLGKNSREGC